MRVTPKVCLRGVVVLAAAASVLFLPTHASGQTVVDAGRVEFTSPDHDATSQGVAIVTSYEFQVFQVGSSQMTRSVNLGKPTPETDGFIRVNFLALLSTPLAAGVQYQARVAAVGPGGVAASGLSNVFSFTPTCEPTLSSTGASLPAGASTGSVTVNAASGCTWSATSPVNWVTITSGDSGTGNEEVTFSVTQNTTSSPRSATLTIATRSFAVTQAGAPAPCTYTISPTNLTAAAAGETTTVTVTTGNTCEWFATSNASWIAVNGGSDRTGGGSVAIVVTANPGTGQRAGTATIAGRTFNITQEGSCGYTIAPGSRSPDARGETTSVAVTTGDGCTWSATSNAGWLTVNGGTNRTGSGNVSIVVAENTATSSRTGTVTVAGRPFTVNQSGVCAYTVTPLTISPGSGGGTTSVRVTTGSTCTWSATSNRNWITVSGGTNRTGNGNVSVVVDDNTQSAPRSGTVTVAGQTVNVNQSGACAYTVAPAAISAGAAGNTGTIAVTTGASCSWNITGVPSWIALSTRTRTGSLTVSYTIRTNSAAASRNTTITVAGEEVRVSQAGTTPPLTTPTGLRIVPVPK
jgi:Putative binding domain, N-terminal/Viral BACON domain